jgi:hypothetical protein
MHGGHGGRHCESSTSLSVGHLARRDKLPPPVKTHDRMFCSTTATNLSGMDREGGVELAGCDGIGRRSLRRCTDLSKLVASV